MCFIEIKQCFSSRQISKCTAEKTFTIHEKKHHLLYKHIPSLSYRLDVCSQLHTSHLVFCMSTMPPKETSDAQERFWYVQADEDGKWFPALPWQVRLFESKNEDSVEEWCVCKHGGYLYAYLREMKDNTQTLINLTTGMMRTVRCYQPNVGQGGWPRTPAGVDKTKVKRIKDMIDEDNVHFPDFNEHDDSSSPVQKKRKRGD